MMRFRESCEIGVEYSPTDSRSPDFGDSSLLPVEQIILDAPPSTRWDSRSLGSAGRKERGIYGNQEGGFGSIRLFW